MSFFGTGHLLGMHLFVNKMLIAQKNFLINFTDVLSIVMVIVRYMTTQRQVAGQAGQYWGHFVFKKHMFLRAG